MAGAGGAPFGGDVGNWVRAAAFDESASAFFGQRGIAVGP